LGAGADAGESDGVGYFKQEIDLEFKSKY